jgi:hypothetical protein
MMSRTRDTILSLEILWRSASGWRSSTGRKNHLQRDEILLLELERSTSASPAPQRQSRKQRIAGWRFGVIGGGVATSVVFLINLIVIIILSTRAGANGLLFEGDCDHAQHINSVLHVVINVLSTVVLSSSNYCMQCLSAPTRKEVDVAHAQGR